MRPCQEIRKKMRIAFETNRDWACIKQFEYKPFIVGDRYYNLKMGIDF